MILPIRQIIKALQPLLHNIRPLTSSISRLISGQTDRPVRHGEDDHGSVRTEQPLDSSRVPWRFSVEEKMWTGDVASAVHCKEDPEGGCSLAVAGCVHARERPAEDDGGAEDVLKPCTGREGEAMLYADGQDADQPSHSR